MLVEQIDIADIVVGERARSLNPERVASLKASIAAIDLRTPITVRVIPEMVVDGVTTSEVPVLVAGLHRLQAFKELGRPQILAIIETGSDLDARMWEIAENLHRADLTVTERSEHVAEWVRLSDQRKGAQVAPPGGTQPHDKGIKAAVRDLGIERTEAQRAIKIDGLSPEVKAEAKILRLDNNQTALVNAAKASTKEQQLRSLREHAARRADSATYSEASAGEKRIESFIAAAKRLSAEELTTAREWFDEYCADQGATVFDATASGRVT